MNIEGMKMFIYLVLQLIQENKIEKCSEVEKEAEKGIATYLTEKYNEICKKVGYDVENNKKIDEFFISCMSQIENNEDRKYLCKEDEGLFLLIKCFVNEL